MVTTWFRIKRNSTKEEVTKKNDTVVPVMDSLESFLDVLNRDQRTIITIEKNGGRTDKQEKPRRDFGYHSREDIPQGNDNVSAGKVHEFSFKISESEVPRIGKSIRKISNRNRISRRKFRLDGLCRLGEVFIVGVCLLTIVRVPAVLSAPSTRYHSHKAMEDIPKYMYPCGRNHEEEIDSEYYMMLSKEPDPVILRHIIIRTQSALAYAESFKDKYVQKTFNLPFNVHHSEWLSRWYEWLPNESNSIPKKLGTNVSQTHLESQSFDEFLVNIYGHLQKFAVALEQVVWDQKETDGEFQENFRMTEVHLRNVLCEIRTAMLERGVTADDDVPRSIMRDDIRKMNTTSNTNLRDWLIYRDLMNSLEYVIEVFTFIQNNLQPAPPSSSS